MLRSRLCVCLAALVAAASSVSAQPVPNYDFDWVTVGNVNNPAYAGPSAPNFGTFPMGRGSLSYEYRIAKEELTTPQWLEFINTFAPQSRELANMFLPAATHWGATYDNSYIGPGDRYVLINSPNAPLRPVAGISWRQAAMYCNWLQNNKSSDPSALLSGAYDASTWGSGPGTSVTDAASRMPGAKFFLPSFDEWQKAARYDPNKNGPGAGGWWTYTNMSDTAAALSGVGPGFGTAAGTGLWNFPLGYYADTHSAYGLLDLSGGASEWLENYQPGLEYDARLWAGSSNEQNFQANLESTDRMTGFGGDEPRFGSGVVGLRVASIPAPASAVQSLCVVFAVAVQRPTRQSGRLHTCSRAFAVTTN